MQIFENAFDMSLVNFEDIELVKPKVNIGGKIRSGEGQFYYPWGVALDKITDNIYVVTIECSYLIQRVDTCSSLEIEMGLVGWHFLAV